MQLIAKKGVKIFREYYIDMEIVPPFTPRVARVPIATNEDIESFTKTCGEKIKKFEIIATLKNGVPVYSPYSGTFSELSVPPKVDEENDEILHAVMDVVEDETPLFPMWDLDVEPSKDNILEIIKKAGIIDECTGEYLIDYFDHPKENPLLLIDIVDEQPYDLSKTAVFLQFKKEVIGGATLLAKALGIPKIQFLMNKNFRTQNFFNDKSLGVEIIGVSGKYPLTVAVNRYRRRKKALKIGVLSARAVYRAYYFGEPQLTSVVTVWGEGVSKPANVEVYNGTPVCEILNSCGAFGVLERVVAGGVMRGYTVSPIWSMRRCDGALTVLPIKKHHKTIKCISCGRCSTVCPLGLAPYYLLHESDRIGEGKVKKLCAELCLHCGACSYICPSRIPLNDHIKEYSKKLKRGANNE